MAPEQHRDREIDHRADIYAFCACLWRALAGAPPFGRDSSLEGVLSRKLAGPPSWPKAARAPRRIVAAIERGMAPEPQDRWGSMHELLAVLERRTGRRRSAQLMAVGLLGLGTTGLLAWYETRRQVCAGGAAELETVLDASTPDQIEEAMLRGVPSYAAESWPTLEASLGEYADAWKSEYRRACESTHITKEQSEEVLDLRIACLRRAKLKLGVTISLLRGGDPGALERAFDLVAELHPVAACGDVQRLIEEAPPFSDRAMAEAVAAAREELDAIETREVAGLYGEALEDIRDLTARSSGVPYPLLRAELEFTTGSLLESLGRYEEAVPHLRRAAELALGSGASTLAGDAANTLAFVEGYHLRRADVANTWLTVGLALASPRPGDRDLEGDLYATRADVLVAAGQYDEAERDYRRAIDIRSNTRGPESPDVAAIRDNLGAVLRTVGRYEDAEHERRAAWEILRKTLGAAHPGALTAGLNVASVLQVRGRVADAARLYQDLLPPLERALGGKHPKVIGTRFNLGLTVCSSGDFETGIHQLQRALEDYRSLPDANTAAILQMRQNIGDMLLRDGRYAEGFSLMEQTAADATVQLEPGDAQLGWILGTLGTLASRLSDFEIASTSLERASSHPTLPPAGRAKFLFELAKVRAAQRRPDEARTLGHQALGVLEREADLEPNETEESQREIRTWLARRDE